MRIVCCRAHHEHGRDVQVSHAGAGECGCSTSRFTRKSHFVQRSSETRANAVEPGSSSVLIPTVFRVSNVLRTLVLSHFRSQNVKNCRMRVTQRWRHSRRETSRKRWLIPVQSGEHSTIAYGCSSSKVPRFKIFNGFRVVEGAAAAESATEATDAEDLKWRVKLWLFSHPLTSQPSFQTTSTVSVSSAQQSFQLLRPFTSP